MSLNFPASPSENDTHTEGSITYKWDGAKWIGLGLTPSDRLVEGSNNLEINSSNNLVWTGGNVGIGNEPLRKLDVIGNSILVRPNTITTLDSSGNADAVNNSIIIRCPYGENAATVSNAGNRFGIQFTGANNTTDIPSLNFGDDPFKSASIYGVSEDSGAGYSRKVGMAFYTSNFDLAQAEKLRITGAGDVVIGHTAANAKLHVASGTESEVGNATNPAFQIGGTGNYRFAIHTTNEQAIIANKNGDDGIAFHTKIGALDGTFGEAVRIDANGNVGVGSNNPSQPMTLKRSSSGQGEFGYRLEFEDTDGPTQTSSALLVGSYGLKLKNYNSGRNFLFETGDIGIGTDSPVNRMTLDNDGAQDDAEGNFTIRYTGTTTTINSGLTAKNYTGTSQFMQWDSQGLRMGNRIVTNGGGGNVYITAGGDTVRLTINSSTGNFTGSSSADISDGRLKENITSISNATATIKQLLGKTFTWKEEAKLGTDIKYGFIAQEIKTVLPDLVYQDVGINRVSKDADKQGYGQGEIVDDYSDDYKDDSKSEWSMAVNTSGIIPVLVEAFKELEARVAALEG